MELVFLLILHENGGRALLPGSKGIFFMDEYSEGKEQVSQLPSDVWLH